MFNMTHNQRIWSLRAKCERASEHFNVKVLEEWSDLIE